MPIDYQGLGRRIREKRKARGLSQEKLAEQVDLSKQHIGNVEKAHNRIGLEKLVDIANVLHCSVDELLCDSIVESKTIYSNEVAGIVETFSEAELRTLPEFLRYFAYMSRTLQDTNKK